MRTRTITLALFLGILSQSPQIWADGAHPTSHYVMGNNVGLGGYDPVTYFREGGSRPQKGFVLRNYVHEGITYRFVSDANLEKFKENPEKYLPQYGGWCAWALAKLNKTVDIEPRSYLVHEGKLYVFYNHRELDARKDFVSDIPSFIAKADANWHRMSH